MKVLNNSEKIIYEAVMNTIVWKKKQVPVKENPFGEDDKW